MNNPQLAIVGVNVVTLGSDQGQMMLVIEQVSDRCVRAPEAWLVDSSYVGQEQIDRVSLGTLVCG